MKKLTAIVLCIAIMLTSMLTVFAAAESTTFTDVPKTHWAYDAIQRAYDEGLISGTSYNKETGARTFSPDKTMTLGQFAAIFSKKFFPADYSDYMKVNKYGKEFRRWDYAGMFALNGMAYNKSADWYRENVARPVTCEEASYYMQRTLERSNVQSADFTLTLTGTYLTRAQAAVICMSLSDYIDAYKADTRTSDPDAILRQVAYITGIDESFTEYEKVYSIYHYLTENYNYDYTYKHRTMQSLFSTGTGVCASFAEAMNFLCKSYGIESKTVVGIANHTGEQHAWNVVKVDGKWYQCDACWDLQKNNYADLYFLLSDADMRKTHTYSSNGIPACSENYL